MAKKKPIRFGELTIEEVERLYHNKKDVVKIFGKKVCTKATNLKVFFTNLTCCSCGLKGEVFIVEQHHDQKDSEWAYLALYSNNRRFTKDHIVPRSKGGADNLKNYQTMCDKCNRTKDNKVGFTELRKGHCKPKHRIFLIFHCITGHSIKKWKNLKGRYFYRPKNKIKRFVKRLIGYSHATPRNPKLSRQHPLRRSGN